MVFVAADNHNYPVGNVNACCEYSGIINEKKRVREAGILLKDIPENAAVRYFLLTYGNRKNGVIHKS